MKPTTLLRKYIEAPENVMIPGVPDALGARLAEQAGFKAVFLSGYAASASLLGAPDVGLLTMTEMAETARRAGARRAGGGARGRGGPGARGGARARGRARGGPGAAAAAGGPPGGGA